MTFFKKRRQRPPYPRIPYWYRWSKEKQREFLFGLIETHKTAANRYMDRWLKAELEIKRLRKELENE